MDASIFTHTLAALGTLGRAADILSTRVVSPTLKLESNLIARRLGWPFAWSTLLLGLVAYWSRELAVVVITVSFLAAGSNLTRSWVARLLGEAEMERIMVNAASVGRAPTAVVLVCASGVCMAVPGAVLLWLSGPDHWGWYSGVGIVTFGFAIALHGSSAVIRVFRKARAAAV